MKAVISAFARTPFHFAKKGALAEVRPDTLASEVIKAILQRTSIDPETIEDVIAGHMTERLWLNYRSAM